MGLLKKIGIIIGIVVLAVVLLLIVAHITHASDSSVCTRCHATNQSVAPAVPPVPESVQVPGNSVSETPGVNCTGSETCPLPAMNQTP